MLTRISSSSPPPPAVVPDATPLAAPTTVAPIPEPRENRMDRTDATGTQIKEGNSSQKTSLLQAALDPSGTSPKIGFRDPPVKNALYNLPNETLIMIAGHCSDSSLLALRGVNKHLQDIAQTKTSATQNFVLENGATLQAMGYRATAMRLLARSPAAEQNFVLEHRVALRAMGYSAFTMSLLARRPTEQQNFVLAHGVALRATGHSAFTISDLARRPTEEQNFVLKHGAALQAMGYHGYSLSRLATLPVVERHFVLGLDLQ